MQVVSVPQVVGVPSPLQVVSVRVIDARASGGRDRVADAPKKPLLFYY